ncbi:hypothetical protein ACVDG8_010865 [Mesorhizobium sp. ORM8.1]
MNGTWGLPENDWTNAVLVVLSYNPDLEHQAKPFSRQAFDVDGQTSKSP